MKKLLLLCTFTAALTLLPACKYAHGDGPDVAQPRRQSTQKKDSKRNPRKSNWLTENVHRERVGRKDVNTPGVNDDFQVFPTRNKYRSKELKKQSSPFPWK